MKVRCEADWKAVDHITLVANITRNQIRRLWEEGISTVRGLAALPAASRVPGIQPDTLDRLRHQAVLQIAKRDTDTNHVETLPAPAGKGVARLPRPDAEDIFFDMEGAQFFGIMAQIPVKKARQRPHAASWSGKHQVIGCDPNPNRLISFYLPSVKFGTSNSF
jgi:hypothetical protein